MTDGYTVMVPTPGTSKIRRASETSLDSVAEITDRSPALFREDGGVDLPGPHGTPSTFDFEEAARQQLARSLETIRTYERTGIGPGHLERTYFQGTPPDFKRREVRRVQPWLTLASWYLENAQVVPYAEVAAIPNHADLARDIAAESRVARARIDLDRARNALAEAEQAVEAERSQPAPAPAPGPSSDWSGTGERGIQQRVRKDGHDRLPRPPRWSGEPHVREHVQCYRVDGERRPARARA